MLFINTYIENKRLYSDQTVFKERLKKQFFFGVAVLNILYSGNFVQKSILLFSANFKSCDLRKAGT